MKSGPLFNRFVFNLKKNEDLENLTVEEIALEINVRNSDESFCSDGPAYLLNLKDLEKYLESEFRI